MSIHFTLPSHAEATRPPEARGLHRDDVRLLAATSTRIAHRTFKDIGQFLDPGDLLVVNTSPTRAGALTGRHPRHGAVVVHVSTRLDDGGWVIELRSTPNASEPIRDARAGERVTVEGSLALTLVEPYPGPAATRPRLWRVQSLGDLDALLGTAGRPIRYGYLDGEYPLSAYQTVFPGLFRGEPGASAEMPSAGRPFSRELVLDLRRRGVRIAPLTLHTGVSSPEHDEPPAPEPFAVPLTTASMVNLTRKQGGRVIAVGTTVVRALETVAGPDGLVRAGKGWTETILGPKRPARAVGGLITGLHDPDASHLLLLEAVVGADVLQRAYDAAVAARYQWHEFGDSCLLVSPWGESSRGPNITL
jgi:S-adenosylmethionine:tRNA ribosyltransferase-isomerase